MASKLIGLSGYAQSGKDTTANILIDEFGFTRVAFADALREALYSLNPIVRHVSKMSGGWDIRVQDFVDEIGWDRAKVQEPEIRALLQRLGTEVGRNLLGDNIWVKLAMAKVQEIPGPVVITDMRFPNEYDAVAAYLGERWRIERPGTEPVNAHPSETALDGYPFDEYIKNEGSLDDLYDQVVLAMTVK